jgi:hypothetical protein
MDGTEWQRGFSQRIGTREDGFQALYPVSDKKFDRRPQNHICIQISEGMVCQ